MSLRLEHSVEIAAPAAVVWEVVTDLSSYPAWNPFVVRCESTLEVGAPISMRVRILPFWAQPQRERILEHDPGKRLCYGLRQSSLGALASSRCHVIHEVTPSLTRYESRFELKGWLARSVRYLLGGRLAWGFRAMTEAIRDRAEQLSAGAESSAQSTTS